MASASRGQVHQGTPETWLPHYCPRIAPLLASSTDSSLMQEGGSSKPVVVHNPLSLDTMKPAPPG
jgi:hypothetical protein